MEKERLVIQIVQNCVAGGGLGISEEREKTDRTPRKQGGKAMKLDRCRRTTL